MTQDFGFDGPAHDPLTSKEAADVHDAVQHARSQARVARIIAACVVLFWMLCVAVIIWAKL